MSRRSNPVHIPLSTTKAIAGLLAVKPTADMPRPGSHPVTAKKATDKIRKTRA